MTQTAASFLTPWANFYIMTGSSAAALTGLTFIVITLVQGEERSRRSQDGVSTFTTPTVVHFCAALFASAVLSAPWQLLAYPAGLLGIAGLYGTLYVCRIIVRTRYLTVYTVDTEDRIWYNVFPLVAYVALLGSAMLLAMAPGRALFGIAGAVIFLIFIGIRNAWDVVTFLATGGTQSAPE